LHLNCIQELEQKTLKTTLFDITFHVRDAYGGGLLVKLDTANGPFFKVPL